MLRVIKIWNADIYRDGGSYGFSFDSVDGKWYEFFLQTTAFESEPTETHRPPVIFLEGVNGRQAVKSLSWEEANAYLAPLGYESERFAELLEIVKRHGKP